MAMLVESGKGMAAILEDDVTLPPDFPRVLEALEQQGGLFDVVTLYRNFQRDPVFETCRLLTRGVSLGRIARMQTGAVGYVIPGREKIPRRHADLRACGGQGNARLLRERP